MTWWKTNEVAWDRQWQEDPPLTGEYDGFTYEEMDVKDQIIANQEELIAVLERKIEFGEQVIRSQEKALDLYESLSEAMEHQSDYYLKLAGVLYIVLCLVLKGKS